MNGSDRENYLVRVRSVARAAIAIDLRDYPWEQLPPAQARALHASLPEPINLSIPNSSAAPKRVQKALAITNLKSTRCVS
jgi:hypothetical protein